MRSTDPPGGTMTGALTAICAALTVAGAIARTANAAEIVVEGQALNNFGGGVLGAKVQIETMPAGGKRPAVLATGQTNKTGDFKLKFELPADAGRKLRVRIEVDAFKTFTEVVDLDEDDEPFVVADLVGSLVLSGRVTRVGSGQPVAGARVSFVTQVDRFRARTDRDGRYKIDRLQPAGGRLEVTADKFARERIDVDLEASRTVDVELRHEYEVQITVVDDRGKPVPDVTIEAFSREPRRSYSAITDDAGRAKLKGVHPDAAELEARLLTEIHITPRGWDRVISLPSGSDKVAKKFVLPRPATLAGQVVRARDGKPVASARVSIGPKKSAWLTSTTADYQGRFEIVGLPAEEVIATAQHADHAPELKAVRLKPAQTVQVKLTLPPGATLTGVVQDEAGRPVAKAHVLSSGWRRYDTVVYHARTDTNGQFAIEHVPIDGIILSVRANGFEPFTTTPLKPGRKRHELVIAPKGSEASPQARPITLAQIASLGKLETLDGKPLGAEQLRGKFVLISVWATWCSHCRTELPHLKAARKAFAGRKDFVVVGVSLDEDETVLRRFIQEQQIPWPQLFGESGRVAKIKQALGVRGVPSTFLFGPAGSMIGRDLRGANLTQQLKTYFAATAGPDKQVIRPEF